MPTPESIAREAIDDQLTTAGWTVKDRAAMNLYGPKGLEFEAATESGLKRAGRLRQAVLRVAFEG